MHPFSASLYSAAVKISVTIMPVILKNNKIFSNHVRIDYTQAQFESNFRDAKGTFTFNLDKSTPLYYQKTSIPKM